MQQAATPPTHIDAFLNQIKRKSDAIVNYFLLALYLCGFVLATFYETWEVAIGVGSLSLAAYYITKWLLRESDVYQYVLSTVVGIFMAQYIYQMHGLFEMHFMAFVGSALLITYQNWKLQIPLALVVIVHHALFAYLQYAGYEKVYFTQLDFMDLQTFAIHGILATAIFFISGLWAHHFKKYSERHIEQTFEMGRLQEERLQRDTLIALSEDLKQSNARLNEAQHIASLGSWTCDLRTNHVQRSDEFYNIFQRTPAELGATPESYLACMVPEDAERADKVVKEAVAAGEPFSYEARVMMHDGSIKTVFAQGKTVTNEQGEPVKTHGTVQDITTRKAHEQALLSSNNELRKSNHELDKFVYSVSHDLRSPLLSMKGIADITMMETREALTRQHMEMIKGSIDRLDRFIGEILNYSRNARGAVQPQPVDFSTLVSDVTNDLQHMLAGQKAVEIAVDVRQQSAFHSDDGRLRIILNNLVSNAIRYRNPELEKPEVKISIHTTGDGAQISVADNGIGIAEEFQEKVFDMFYRVSERSNGSGLGLYIVKETVAKLNGHIQLHSQQGHGTTFQVRLPNLLNLSN